MAYTAKDRKSEAASGSDCITEINWVSFAELSCGRSPAACWDVLQLNSAAETTNRPPRSQSLVGKARTSLFFGSFGTAWAANIAQAKLCSPKVLLVDFMRGLHTQATGPRFRTPGKDTPSSQC